MAAIMVRLRRLAPGIYADLDFEPSTGLPGKRFSSTTSREGSSNRAGQSTLGDLLGRKIFFIDRRFSARGK
jgi:hypothetical protein